MLKIPSVQDLERLKDQRINFDIETEYWLDRFIEKKIKYIQFGTVFEPRERFRFDPSKVEPEVIEKFKEVYQTWSIVGSNLQFDMGQIYYYFGVMPKEVGDDSYILARMAQEQDQGLKKLVDKYFGVNKPEFDFPIDKETKRILYEDERFDDYSEYDITYPDQLCDKLLKVHGSDINNFIYRLEKKMAMIAAKAEARGIAMDMSDYQSEINSLQDLILEKEKKINAIVGYDLNVGSTKQVAKALYEEQGLECVSRTPKGTPSVNEKALNHLRGNELVDLIIEVKKEKSILSSLSSLPEYVDSNNETHINWKLIGYDATSRVYNEPSVTSLPKTARRMFVARPGKKFIYFDLKSAELFMCMVCGKQNDFVEKYFEGADLHRFTASKVFGVAEDLITKEQRNAAKTVNFAILYGASGYTIAKDLNVSESEGDKIYADWLASFPAIENHIRLVHQNAGKIQRAITPFGRVRKLPNRNGYLSQEAYRQSLNTRYQSGVADCLKIAVTKLDAKGYDVMLSVFDSCLLEVDENMSLEQVTNDVAEALDFTKLIPNLKFRFEIAEGKTWLDAYEGA